MPIEKIVPGHGPVMGLEIVEKPKNLFEQLKENTLQVLSNNGMPEEIVIPQIFEITDDIQWIIDRTRNHWHKLYSETMP